MFGLSPVILLISSIKVWLGFFFSVSFDIFTFCDYLIIAFWTLFFSVITQYIYPIFQFLKAFFYIYKIFKHPGILYSLFLLSYILLSVTPIHNLYYVPRQLICYIVASVFHFSRSSPTEFLKAAWIVVEKHHFRIEIVFKQ